MNIIQLNLNSSAINDAQEVASYLNNGSVLLAAASLEQDVKDPAKGNVVPIGWATDGTNVWPLSLIYYVQNYQVGIDDAFLSEIRNNNYQCESVNEERLEQIRHDFADQTSENSEAPQALTGESDVNPFK